MARLAPARGWYRHPGPRAASPVAADGIAALADRRGSAQRGAPLLAAAVRRRGRSRMGGDHRRARGCGFRSPRHRSGQARLFGLAHRPVVLVGLVLVFLAVFSGESMVLFYAPTVLEQIGFTDTAVTFAATLGLGVVGLIATLIALAVVDRTGRKPMVVTGLIVLGASLLAMAALTTAPQAIAVVRWGQVACLAVFVAIFGFGSPTTAIVRCSTRDGIALGSSPYIYVVHPRSAERTRCSADPSAARAFRESD
jgi:hypothetical protein